MRLLIGNLMMIFGAGFVSAEEVARLPEVTVSDKVLKEEQPVGPYGQPEWTMERRFTTTRVYVQQPPWGMGVEQWWRGQFLKGGGVKSRLQTEYEIGLPHRFQLDLYETWVINEHQTVYQHDVAGEVRWALADWGKIPLNPTVYGEWKFVENHQGGNVYELKLLLGEELAPRWHWGFNVVLEQEVSQARATEWAASQGISYTVRDEKLSVGMEMKFVFASEAGARSDPATEFLIGPSVQWRPTRNSHLDLVPLFGTTYDSPHVEAYVVFGISFGPGNEPARGAKPVSTLRQ